ncbi:MAG TPA: hypothetical protein VFA50_07560 [Stellaceae bacterium]|nr:hypothetical protein [Stellaceae bacterium]
MKQRLALVAGLLLIGMSPAIADSPLQQPDYQKMCTDGVRKLGLGEQVIGTSQANIAAAAAARASAEKAMQAQDYYGCWQSVEKGLKALDAG